MCGRMSCFCAPEVYSKAFSHFDSTRNKFVPLERKVMSEYSFEPKAVILPGDIVPVLMSSSDTNVDAPVLQDMIWGFQPSWGKIQDDEKNYSTHNCRIEGVKSSRLFSSSLQSGRRCIVFCEGYYEGPPGKKHFFIHHSDNDEFHVQHVSYWGQEGLWNEKSGWSGPKFTKLAGIYNVRKERGEKIYSFTILTRESTIQLASVHHRTPVILNYDDELKDWLDGGRVSSHAAVDNVTNLTRFNVNIKTISAANKKLPPVQKNTLANWVIKKKSN